METSKKTKIDFTAINSIELLEYIGMKKDFPTEAAQAFVEFCARFERDILEKSEIYCSKFNYNEVVALRIANCCFSRVWKYPTFNSKIAKSRNPEKAILIWMYPIIFRQIIKFGNENKCEEDEIEQEYKIITSVDDYIESWGVTDIESKRELKAKLRTIERTLDGLSHKHKVIYFTYKLYEKDNKKLPRLLLEKLRDNLNITQKSINTYKNQAEKRIEFYLNFLNND
ncbi:RNA polymerase subunit sigma [Zunongwangia sp. HGR-M22]|uniref:RNA polymerase subunit sigma n=1 Tax=Zunongwangia sp. HGR-M22 TaxID=3015168 RepID=UPI0022DDE3F3|nr:RNA polymerase subunit sigma [Zunongwangia sp. HGR-M22]WBL26772.1 RNA polymerase subunit sigma [Zunongwangia sp. HGR-M22]